MIYLLVGSHTIIKGKRHFTFQFSNSRNTYVSLKFRTNYIVEIIVEAVCCRIDLNDAIRLIYDDVLYTLLVKFSLLATTQK